MFFDEVYMNQLADYLIENNDGVAGGGFLVAEKTKNGVEATWGGEPDQVLEILTASVFGYARSNGLAMEDVLKDISDAFEKMQDSKKRAVLTSNGKGCKEEEKQSIDLQTLLGVSADGEMVHFPVPPKDLQEKMMKDMQEMEPYQEIADRVAKKLESLEGIREIIGDGSTLGVYTDDTGSQHIRFLLEGLEFDYDFEFPGEIGALRSKNGTNFFMTSEFNDVVFRELMAVPDDIGKI